MQVVLIDILCEAGAKNKWKKRQGSEDASLDDVADWQLFWGLFWMSFCADAEGKAFLMKVASDRAVDSEFRARAVSAYLWRADEKERLEAVTRFLAGDMKGTVDFRFSGIYNSAILRYDKAEGDPKTREAIVAMISAVLLEGKGIACDETDKLLAERSKEYAESPQRKAALERMNPPDKRRAP